MSVLDALGHALGVAGSMTWQVTWSLILGFTLSAVVQAVVRRQTVARLLGDDRPKTLALATGLGAASSSCSYAAVALARALFRRGADFTAAMAFEIASTNLVIELGIILALLLSWQFTLAEFIGGPVIFLLLAAALLVRFFRSGGVPMLKTMGGSPDGHRHHAHGEPSHPEPGPHPLYASDGHGPAHKSLSGLPADGQGSPGS